MKKMTLSILAAAMVATMGGTSNADDTNGGALQSKMQPAANMCFARLKPMKPLFCDNGYVVCVCDDPYDFDTCRWIWVCR